MEQSKSKNTYKEYRGGIAKFCEWYKKTPDQVLEERRQNWISGDLFRKKAFARTIERFHKWLLEPIHTIKGKPNQKYSINSARTYTLGILQCFRYFEMPVTIDVGSNVSKTVISTKDFVPTPEQLRKMYSVASDLRAKLIVSMGLNLGWRIGDFLSITKDMIPDLEQDAPIAFDLITEKEDVLAKSFISAETCELLKEYLPTTEHTKNPYLFPSNGKRHLSKDTVNRILRQLAERANIKIPRNKRLRFHSFRKRFLTECANQSIDINIAKVLVGKSVEKSMLTYLSEVEHRKGFLRLHTRMRLTEKPMEKSTKSESESQAEIRRLNRVISGIVALGGQELVEKAKKIVEISNIGKMRLKTKPQMTVIDLLETIGRDKELQEQKQYARMIAENNDNNNDS